jgi:hypothetical protein
MAEQWVAMFRGGRLVVVVVLTMVLRTAQWQWEQYHEPVAAAPRRRDSSRTNATSRVAGPPPEECLVVAGDQRHALDATTRRVDHYSSELCESESATSAMVTELLSILALARFAQASEIGGKD